MTPTAREESEIGMPRQKIPIAQPLTPAQARKWLKVGMVVAWRISCGDDWHINKIGKKDTREKVSLKWIENGIKKFGDRVVILEK